ncbi:hypothetical protein E1193_19750 [Micromonospora sp. KC606]|uniref:hypothetical protein n=1 Tax=Micromonospora sp. KC606 TaxID=2530379 RepID=UPI0010521060|nr:hypothetical protein [Micromonospora sp. KC606]TDC79053.1 hypothetical protein E1193_19750 [Micromonospora sp. KC606]
MLVASLLLILVAVALLVLGLADGSSALLVSSIAVSLLAAVALVVAARQVAVTRATGDRLGPRTGRGFAGRSRPTAPPATVAPAQSAIPVQHVPTAFGAGGDGWRQPPEPPATGAVDGPWESHADAPGEPEGVATRHVSADEATGARESAGATERGPDGDLAGPWRPVSPAPSLDVTAERAEPVSGGAWPDDEPEVQSVSPVDAARVARLDTEVRVVDGRPRYHLASCPHLFGRDDEPLPAFEAVSLGFTPCAACAPDTSLLADAPPG